MVFHGVAFARKIISQSRALRLNTTEIIFFYKKDLEIGAE